MKSSVSSSSAKAPTSPSSDGQPRKRFALSGRSVALDPRTNAFRSDMADIRLSDRIFAPRYVKAMTRSLCCPAALRSAAGKESEIMAQLQPGTAFEVFDIAAGSAWGIATGEGLVGYIDAAALDGPVGGKAVQ